MFISGILTFGGPPLTYTTWNPSDKAGGYTLTTGNLTATLTGGGGWFGLRSIIAKSAGKWFWEARLTSNPNGNARIGIANATYALGSDLGVNANSIGYDNGGTYRFNGTSAGGKATIAVNDYVGIAYDAGAGTVTFYKNGASQGQCTQTLSGTIYAAACLFSGGAWVANFGASAFQYSVPGGYNSGLYT